MEVHSALQGTGGTSPHDEDTENTFFKKTSHPSDQMKTSTYEELADYKHVNSTETDIKV